MITTSRAEEIAKARGVTVEIVDNRLFMFRRKRLIGSTRLHFGGFVESDSVWSICK